jgi:alpha-L-rhamnosidase
MRRIVPTLLTLACLSVTARAEDALRLSALTVEHLNNPIGIGADRPRLSWKLQSSRQGEKQTAYEIRAASAAAKLEAADLWASGKVASDQSVLVPWAGKPLGSHAQVVWQVRAWDKDGQPSAWSDPATFELGLTNSKAEWKGSWITADLPRVDAFGTALANASWINAGSAANQAAAARLVVELPAGAAVRSAALDAAADGLITFYVNGQAIRQGSSSHTAPFYATFNTYLKPGKNVIAVGAGPVRNAGRGPGGPGKNAIAAHGVIELDNGQRIEFNTDGHWKAAVAPAAGWFAPDFDDAPWAAATVLSKYSEQPPIRSAEGSVGPGRYLRKTFSVKGPVAKARLYATALGTYEASINGKPVSDERLSPGWTDYNTRVMVQTYDVTKLLTPGQNAVGAVLTDGWFAGRVGWMGLAQYARVGTRPVFAGQLEITYADGSTETIATDGSWKGGPGAVVGSDQQLGEIIDNRKAGPWDQPAFNDADWKAVAVEQHDNISLDPQLGPPVRALTELAPQKITRVGGNWVVDLGQNMVGHIRLKARGPAGTTVTVRHSEMLNPDGTLYTENLRPAISVDTFVLKGGETETFEPQFTFHGFRYVELVGYPGELTADALQGVVVASDTPPTGTWECSNADVNRLYQNIVWGQRSNFLSVPTDCPQRDERMGWMGDAQVFSPTAARNADVAAFFMKWMVDVNDGQSPDGAFNNVNPRANQNQSYPVWGDAGVIIPWVMYTSYGDKAFLEKNYDHMAKWVNYTKERYPTLLPTGGVGDHLAPAGGRGAAGFGGAGGGGAAPGGAAPARGRQGASLTPAFPADGLFPVAAPAAGGTGTAPAAGAAAGRGAARGRGGPGGFGGGVNTTTVVDTAYFARSAWILSKSAALLGKADDAARYEQLYKDVAAAFNKAFVQPDGSIQAGTQTTYLLALQFGLLPENLRAAAAKHLTDDVETRGHLTTGFVGVGFLNPTLCDIGRTDLAYQLLLNDTYPSWLFTVKNGATTMWERWDGWTPERGFQDSSMNSFNHYSFGSIGEWLYSGAAGIRLDPDHPGFKQFTLAPQLTTKLTHVKASLDSPYGVISSHWHAEGDTIAYDVTVPPNTTATVVLPGQAPQPVTAGSHHFSVPRSAVK